jgi:hypothetical protein
VDPDDGVACTVDSCDPVAGVSHVPTDGLCDDADLCNGAETCDAVLDCQAGTPPVVDDADACTVDSCDPASGVSHVPVNPDDGVSCTLDSCDPATGVVNIPTDGLCDNGQFCDGAETCDPLLDCQAGTDPCDGAACDEAGDICLSTAPAPRMEAGTVAVGGTPVTVTLQNRYASPVVVGSVQYDHNTTPVVVRVSNVTSGSFDVRLQNPSNGGVAIDYVHYQVVEEGVWTIDGIDIEAHTYLSTVTDGAGSWVGDSQSYGHSYANPVVLGQVMSENDPDWSVFWCSANGRPHPPSATQLRTGKGVGEDPDITRAAETVGFIVYEAGAGTIGGVAFEAAVGPSSVGGVVESPPYIYAFGSGFASAPGVAVTTMAGINSQEGAWAMTYGPVPTTPTTLSLALDEDQVGDAERVHTDEQVGYVVFEAPFFLDEPASCVVAADCDDGQFCNGEELCVGGSCVPGSAVSCDDGVSCTADACIEATDSCQNVPTDALCDNGLFCDGTETCDAVLDCQPGTDPCAGEACDETGDTCSSTGAMPQMETGTMTVGGTPLTVPLTHAYVSPVVVGSVQYANNTAPVVVRVSNVTTQSFDVRLQNPSGEPVVAENVSYLVVEEGVWTIDGVKIEAQTYLSSVTDGRSSWLGEPQVYRQSYTNPVVLGQVMSENDPGWSVFWCSGSGRNVPPTGSALSTGKHVGEDPDTSRSAETIGFIVIEAGSGTIAGTEFAAALGPDTVRGVTDAPPYDYSFSSGFASAPLVALTSIAAMDDNQGAWAMSYGAVPTTATTLSLAVDEDQVRDAERSHRDEQVGYVVFGAPFALP